MIQGQELFGFFDAATEICDGTDFHFQMWLNENHRDDALETSVQRKSDGMQFVILLPRESGESDAALAERLLAEMREFVLTQEPVK